MYYKIALENVKKSFRDYTIYFLTLTLAVCIFYSFNSIESQKAMMEMNSSSSRNVKSLAQIISYVSVFVAFILGSLILYANNFLIKKRNKEMGIYMTLGMSKRKISQILVIETLLVGIFSLISGLILGLFVSQGLSVLVVKLFDFKISNYIFIISTSAMIKTILYFGIMFILVIILNSFVISKYKIIDLLTVAKKTEEIKFKNPIIYLFTFILCMISLITAYKFILDVGIMGLRDPKFLYSIILGVIGTFLFFFSLTGFILYVVKKNKRVYFKGLNIFIIKQINSKVKTNFISMSVICLMLFLTITILSTGFSFKNSLESGLDKSTPYDASAYLFVDSKDGAKDIKKSLKYIGVKFNKDDKVAYFNQYTNGEKIEKMIPLDQKAKVYNTFVTYIKISDYNNIRKIKNQRPINLDKNEVLITSNFAKMMPPVEKYMKNNNTIKIDKKVYRIKNKDLIKENIMTDFMQNNLLTVIVNDKLCENMKLYSSNVNINFGSNKDKNEAKFVSDVDSYKKENTDYNKIGFVLANSRNQIYESNTGMVTIILFLVIYIGIVFLISSMAILALQQLSEASDSIERYISLKRLGASEKSINKTIFVQTLVYFTIPVGLALVHSIVGVKVANSFIEMYSTTNILGSSLITALIFIFIYAIYFCVTYSGYKNIVKNNI